MKQKQFLIFFFLISLFGCKKSNEEVVKDFLNYTNAYDSEKLRKILDENFYAIYRKSKMNKTEFLLALDSLKILGQKNELVNFVNHDSIIITDESLTDYILTGLDINPKPIQHSTYKIQNGKIISILTDTIIESKMFWEEIENKYSPFEFFLKDSFGLYVKEAMPEMKKYLGIYNSFPLPEKKRYRIYSNLQGTYFCPEVDIFKNTLPVMIFKGKFSVICIDVFSMPLLLQNLDLSEAHTYDIDGDYVRIHTGDEVALFRIVDYNTLEGESSGCFGTYKKTHMSYQEMAYEVSRNLRRN